MVNNVGVNDASWVGVVYGMPRAGSYYNLGTSRGPDKIGSRAGPGPRAVSCTWLVYIHGWMQWPGGPVDLKTYWPP